MAKFFRTIVLFFTPYANVCFSYDNGEKVLSDVSFIAKQGEVTALVGPSGGGKTTVSRLAARFWDPESGRITVGGMDVTKTDPESLLSLYSIVFQDVTLFDNTIMENIRIGRRDASDEEVIEAGRMAQCLPFVEKLSDGWNTMIGENGRGVSEGQKQRILLARAIYDDPDYLFLDEMTSSLDAGNEDSVLCSLKAKMPGKTIVIVSHRPVSIMSADFVIVMKNGSVVEAGTHKSLIEKNSEYCRLLKPN